MALFENITKKIRSALSTYGLTPPADNSFRGLRHSAFLEVHFPDELFYDLSNGKNWAFKSVHGKVDVMGPKAAAKLIAAASDQYYVGETKSARDFEHATLYAAMLGVPGVKEALKKEQAKWWRSKEDKEKISRIIKTYEDTNVFRHYVGLGDPKFPNPFEKEKLPEGGVVERLKGYARQAGTDNIPSMLRQIAPEVGETEDFKKMVNAVFVHATTKENSAWTLDTLLNQMGAAVLFDSLFAEERKNLVEGSMSPAERRAFLEKIDQYEPSVMVKLTASYIPSLLSDLEKGFVRDVMLGSPKVQKWARTNEIETMMPDGMAKQFRTTMKCLNDENKVADALGFNQKGSVTPEEMDRRIENYLRGAENVSEGINHLHVTLFSLVKKYGDIQPFAQAYVRCEEKVFAGSKNLDAVRNGEIFQEMQVLADGGQDAKAQAAETAPRVSHAAQARISLARKTKGPGGP